MVGYLDNWRTQIRKGYLELCLLLVIKRHKRVYGFDLLEKLREMQLPLKEGTLYPLLSRMTDEGTLSAAWETSNLKGHPRKFYSLTKEGSKLLDAMRLEFAFMIGLFTSLDDSAEAASATEPSSDLHTDQLLASTKETRRANGAAARKVPDRSR